MGYRVRLLPSGHTFEAEAHETLLEAALRAGVNLSHGCTSGTCGECRARVISGPTETVRFHDFALGEAEKQSGTALLCSTAAVGDLVVEAPEAEHQEDIPWQRIDARVAKVERLGGAVTLLQLRTPRTRTLRFLAGQYVELRLGDGLCRALPVASCPCNGLILQFHVQREAGDAFSEAVSGATRVGDGIQVQGPVGGCTLDESSARELLFVAEGTGFAPVKSLVEHVIALELPQPVTLAWVADRPDGHYLGNYCRAWADALDDFTFLPLAREGDADDAGLVRGIVAAVADPAAVDLYLCAGEALTAALGAAFTARGVPSGRVFADAGPGGDGGRAQAWRSCRDAL